MKTLEQVIMDASKDWCDKIKEILSIDSREATAIAEAVRGWLDELVKGEGHPYQSVVRIKELEAEVARLASLKSSPGCCDKAAKYDELRAKFPFLPGEEFWFCNGNRITKRKVDEIDETHVLSGEYGLYQSECHPTADACRAAIPVEE